MQVANTLAYYHMAIITAVKSFIVQAPGANVISLITAVIYEFSQQARVVVPGKLLRPSQPNTNLLRKLVNY